MVREPTADGDGTRSCVTGAGGKDRPNGETFGAGTGKALGTGMVPLANSAENGGELDILNFSVSDGGLEAMEPVEVWMVVLI